MRSTKLRGLAMLVIFSGLAGPAVSKVIQPVEKFDVSENVGDPGEHSRVYIAATPTSLVAVNLGRSTRAIYRDVVGNSQPLQLLDFPEPNASRAFLADDGVLWLFGVSRAEKRAYAASYDPTGQRTGIFPISRVPRGVVGTRLLYTSLDGVLRTYQRNGNSYKDEKAIDIRAPLHSLILPLNRNKAAVIAQNSGDLSMVDLDRGTGVALHINSPAIQRELALFREGGIVAANAEPIVVSGVTKDESGAIFYLLGSVFPHEGATVLRLAEDGNVLQQSSYSVPDDFSPTYISVVNKNLFVADSHGHVFRFERR